MKALAMMPGEEFDVAFAEAGDYTYWCGPHKGAWNDRNRTCRMNEDEKREFYKQLRERIKQLRMEHLFEEPCPLYEDDDEDT